MSWTCRREAMYMLVYKHVENDHTANHQLDIVPPQELSSILHFWIFFNPTNYGNLHLTIYSFILECLQYQNYGLRRNKRDLFTITV